MAKARRIQYEHDLLLDELSLLGWTVFDSAVPDGLVSHIHHEDFEVCYIVQGRMRWWVNDTAYTVKRGDYFVTKPGEHHGGVDGTMERCELYWLQFREPVAGAAFVGLSHTETRTLLKDLYSIGRRAFSAQSNMREHFQRLLSEQHQRGTYGALSSRVALYNILIDMVRSYRYFVSHLDRQADALPEDIRKALNWIDERLAEKLSVADIASSVNMSTSYFHQRFQREVGFSPAEYCMRRRFERAQTLLEADELSISDVAFSLGFSTSQYFATVFKKYLGVSPRAYQAGRKVK